MKRRRSQKSDKANKKKNLKKTKTRKLRQVPEMSVGKVASETRLLRKTVFLSAGKKGLSRFPGN